MAIEVLESIRARDTGTHLDSCGGFEVAEWGNNPSQ